MRDNQGLPSNARCPPAFLSQAEPAQERLLALTQFVLSCLPLVHWLSREGGTNVPTLTVLRVRGPVSDRCQQEHLGPLPGLRGILGANGEHTHTQESLLAPKTRTRYGHTA